MTESLTIREQGSLLAVIERASTDPNVDVAKMEKLLELAERVHARQAEAEYDRAMNAAQAEMRPIATDSDNPQTRSRYASYGALDRAVRPIYSTHGFSLSFGTRSPAVDRITVTCRVSHRAGHTERVEIDMPADGKGAKGGDVMTKTHATGSAVSYGMRYLLKMIFNLAIGEYDDDGNAASGKRKTYQAPAAPAAKPKPAATNQANVEATPEQKTKFLTMLQPVKEAALYYARQKGWILPDVEGLSEIPLRYVPTTQKAFQAIMDDIRMIVDGVPTGATIEDLGEPQEEFSIKGGDEWWRTVIVPIPPKGMKRDEYLKNPRTINDLEKNALFGFWANWQPKSWTGRDGQEHPPSDADIKFREALDAAGEHYGFKVKD